jgi:thymidylate synthase (FAD)
MKIVKPYTEILTPIDRDSILKHIELCGRTCYKSEDLIMEESCYSFAKKLIARNHESVLEHVSISVKFVCDRGVSHEIVRHRLASYSQESTRYCNYSKDKFGTEITVIEPCFLSRNTDGWMLWEEGCLAAEMAYFNLLNYGCSPEEARSVLPNSLKTELVMTANIREWRHFFKLRCASAAHVQMREVAIPLYKKFADALPELFGLELFGPKLLEKGII